MTIVRRVRLGAISFRVWVTVVSPPVQSSSKTSVWIRRVGASTVRKRPETPISRSGAVLPDPAEGAALAQVHVALDHRPVLRPLPAEEERGFGEGAPEGAGRGGEVAGEGEVGLARHGEVKGGGHGGPFRKESLKGLPRQPGISSASSRA